MMIPRLSPIVIAAVYAVIAPLGLGFMAAWMAVSPENIGTVKEWQTLIAGLIAIVAALLGGGFVYYQTSEAGRQERARIARHHAAARSVLPLALSGLVEYAEEVSSVLEGLRRTVVGHRVIGWPGATFTPPSFKPEHIEPLRDLIECASESVGERVARIISDVQVIDSRLRDLPQKLAPGSTWLYLEGNLDSDILHTAIILARCNDLFAYARPASFRTTPRVESIVSALNILGYDAYSHPDLYQKAEQLTGSSEDDFK